MITGSCLCGAVRWRMEGPYARMSNCHCSMCRKAHAAPFATYIIVERDKYELLSGADEVCIYQSSSRMHRKFCSKCGSVTPFDAGEYEVVPAGCLDDDPGIRPGRHIFVASKAPWHEIAGDSPQANEYKLDAPATAPAAARPASQPAILHGSCLCGGVAYEVTTPILAVYNCHCSRCRKARAAAHTTNGFVDPKGLRFTRGADLLTLYKVPEAELFAQAFCRVCGSGMPNIDLTRPRISIPFGTLDDDPGRNVDDHIFCASKAPWHVIADDIPQHAEYGSA